jgi:hypothetical protein
VRVPITNATGSPGIIIQAQHSAFLAFSAQNGQSFGDLTCSIEANGAVINTGHSQGGYAIVSCSAQVP